jgi:hypothetical protein
VPFTLLSTTDGTRGLQQISLASARSAESGLGQVTEAQDINNLNLLENVVTTRFVEFISEGPNNMI